MSDQSPNPSPKSKPQQSETNDNNSNNSGQELAATAPPPRKPPQRQPRPLRPNLRRQIIVTGETSTSVPINARPIELASVLQGGGARAAAGIIPPKRPAYLPARYVPAPGPAGLPHTSGDGVNTQTGAGKPNRYAWAQWQAAAAAAAGMDTLERYHDPVSAASKPHHFSSAASRVLIVNPMHIVNLSEHTKSRLIKSIEGVKRFSEKWFSHVLLLMFLAVYACFGAYIFISFEAPTEQWEKQLIIDTRLKIVNDSWYEASQAKSQEAFVELFRSKFEDYERLLNRACNSGMNSNSLENQWTFWGALFYSMTVFTTIGYGHLTPITFAGRVATMIYAIFGIPILLMVLADLGKLLTRIIKYAFKRFRYLYNKLFKKNKTTIRTQKLIKDNTNQYLGVARDALERGFTLTRIPVAYRQVSSLKSKVWYRKQKPPEPPPEGLQPAPAGQLSSSDVIVTPNKQTKPVSPQADEKKSMADHVHLSQQTQAELSRSGKHYHNQHHQHHHNHHHHHSHSHDAKSKSLDKAAKHRKISTNSSSAQSKSKQAKSSLSRSSSSSLVTSSQATNDTLINSKPIESLAPIQVAGQPPEDRAVPTEIVCDLTGKVDENLIGNEEGEGEEEEVEYHDEGDIGDEEDDFDIPVSFALFLLVTYMMFGAVIFSIWEGWNFFDSLYFVFISMSTIGFGDLVPQHPKRMIGTFIYLLFGLALTSMCINVVQEKIHATFLRAKMQIGEKMGFDLDQIMADDYYDHAGDGGSMIMDGEDDDCELDSVVAISQTNSLATDHPAGQHQQDQDENFKLTSAVSVDVHDQPQQPALRLSKSKESLKSKRRNIASLPGHNSGSIRRKLSTRRAPSMRQSTPTPAAPIQQTQLNPEPQAIKFELEVLRPTQIKMTDHLSCSDSNSNAPPSINQPVNSIKSICEPLRPGNVLRQQQSVKQPSKTIVKSHSSELATNRMNSFNSNNTTDVDSATLAATFRLNQLTSNSSKSANSSRRSSVSQELNQLDDLITALKSQVKQDRFGPLLGIPSSSSAKSSRSNSPSSNGGLATNSRRATSMTSRSPPAHSPGKKFSSICTPPGAKIAPHLASRASAANLYRSTSSNSNTCDLSKSQKALDELEAIKFSAL